MQQMLMASIFCRAVQPHRSSEVGPGRRDEWMARMVADRRLESCRCVVVGHTYLDSGASSRRKYRDRQALVNSCVLASSIMYLENTRQLE